MIARYSRPEMSQIWSERHKYLVWLKVELAVCEELAATGVIPAKAWKDLKIKCEELIAQGGVDPARVEELEAITRHDVIAFTTAVAERIGEESRYIHFGLTSSDVVDTALSLLIQQAGEVLLKQFESFATALKAQAEAYKDLPTIGRSHGIYAEPTSFGLKFLGWHCEWQRNQTRLSDALENLKYGKLSGAVGVNPHWGPAFEEKVLKSLNLKREPVSTQVIPRDRHAEFLNALAIAGSSLERIAVELRHLQRSEVAEVMEGFKKGQKGSSAMPHKRNPISSENITGCARLLRSYAQAALENVALWHERDISHSSVERVILPDATTVFNYALHRMEQVIQQLVVQKEQVLANLKKAGETVFSGHFLLELVQTGVSREEAYVWIQECALGSFEGKGQFSQLISSHPEIQKRLPEKKLLELGSLQYQLRNVDEIYKRASKKK